MFKRVTILKAACISIFLLGFSVSGVYAQETKDVNAHSPFSVPTSKQEKKAKKKKQQQKDLAEKAIEKGRKRHEKIQTRKVRKRMKQSKHTASLNNAHKKEFFLKRWFTRKPQKKNR